MTRQTLVFSLVACSTLALMACSGGDDHPAPQRDPAVAAVANEAVAGESASGDPSDAGFDTRPSPVCVPGTSQTCRLYYQTSGGQWECPESIQYCMPDGADWLPCGARHDQDAQ